MRYLSYRTEFVDLLFWLGQTDICNLLFIALFVTVQSQAKFHKSDVKCLHF